MRMLELFSGSSSMSKAFKEAGYETLSVDIDPSLKPDICIDIMYLTPEMIIERFGYPDVIWASPPCETFSVAAIGKNWEGSRLPKRAEASRGLMVLAKTVELIVALNPRIWFIENPRGMMRKIAIMDSLSRRTVTYCKYGEARMKPTDIWTNLAWVPIEPCKNGSPCHVSAPRGSRTGTQGMKNAYERGIIPHELCKEIVRESSASLGVVV